MTDISNAIIRQVFSLPSLLRQQNIDLQTKIPRILDSKEILSVRKIVLTGCGDSYAACMAAKYFFEVIAGIPTEIVTAIDTSRFYQTSQFGFSQNGCLVIGVSNSGGVARVAEAIMRANHYGALTLGITSNCASHLGTNSRRILHLEIPPFESAPGTRTYLVSILALLLIAIHFGEVNGYLTSKEIANYRNDIASQAELLDLMLPDMNNKICEIANEWKSLEAFDFIGSGPDYATAWYGHAKIFEAVGKYAMHINTEEWLHLNFFARKVDCIGRILVADATNPAVSRSKETLHFINQLTAPSLVITNSDRSFWLENSIYVRVPASKYYVTSPLTQFAPLSLLAGYISILVNEEDGRGSTGLWAFSRGGAAVTNSEIIIK